MSLLQIPAPDLAAVGASGSALYVLEAVGFSADGSTLLVKATFSGASPEQQRWGVWLYDLATQTYGTCLNVSLASLGIPAIELDVLSAQVLGEGAQALSVVQYANADGNSLAQLALLQNGDAHEVGQVLGLDNPMAVERYAISADGRFLAIQTPDSTLAPISSPDTTDVSDIYLIDLQTLKTERVSVVGGAEVHAPVNLGNVVVSDGQVRVTFSSAGKFSTKDTNENALAPNDAYQWSMSFDATGLTGQAAFALLSADAQGNSAAGGVLASPGEVWGSSAGVWFESTAETIVDGDTNSVSDIFYSPSSGPVQRVHLSGVTSLSSPLHVLSVTADGSYAAVLADAPEVFGVAAGAAQVPQLLVWKRSTQQWSVVSQSQSGMANLDVLSGAISPNGQWVAFTSMSDNLVTEEPVALTAQLFLSSFQDAFNHEPTGTVTMAGTAKQGQALTASNTLADADGLGTVSYQWLADGVVIAGATGTTFTLAQAQVGKKISVKASYTDGGATAEAVSSSETVAVANVNDVPTGTVTIAGTAKQGQALTASNTLADADGLGTVSYQWLADGVVIAGATGTTFTLAQAQVGKKISVKASYTDGGATAEAVSSSETVAVANVNDVPTGTVTIAGTAKQGQALTASNTLADADGLGTVSYQWLADGVVIAGATGTTFTLAQAQVGKKISVKASYTDGGATAEAVSSSETVAVANVNDVPTGTVTMAGTAKQGQALTASNTLADADGLGTVSYQWLADGVVIAGATGTTFTLAQAQVGKKISVKASYTDGGATAEAVSSSETVAVANVNDVPTGTVTIAGTAKQGQALTASNTLADADGLGTVSYQWLADGVVIAGATGTTFTLAQAQVGKKISVKASYTDGGATAEAVSSSETVAVANVNDVPTGTVTIAGTAKQGQALTASNTLADADGLGTVSYQWLADGVVIAGATGTTFTLAQAQVGKKISVKASYTDGGATLEQVNALQTTPVVASYEMSGQIYQWKSHALLSGVSLTAGSQATSSDASGHYDIQGLLQTTVSLSASKALTASETGAAVDVTDAVAALRLAAGRNPNADGSAVSPYQYLAADINGDGRVTSADALGILKMALGQSDAPAREWLFVDERQDFWTNRPERSRPREARLTGKKSLVADVSQPSAHNLVAVLKGDVNGSWNAPAGAVDLDVSSPGYFKDLANQLGAPLAQWGVLNA